MSSRSIGRGWKGFTILELMIVLVVVAVLVALAYPSYTQYVRKAKRGEAQQLLMNWSVNQEIFRSNNPAYADEDDIPVPDHAAYEFEVEASPTAFTLTATAQGDQANDVEDGNSCTVLTLNQNGQKGDYITCWGGKS